MIPWGFHRPKVEGEKPQCTTPTLLTEICKCNICMTGPQVDLSGFFSGGIIEQLNPSQAFDFFKPTRAAPLSSHLYTYTGSGSITLPLRHLEDTYEYSWVPYGTVDLVTGLVEFSYDDYVRTPSIFVAKQLELPVGTMNKWNGYENLPDDDKTQLINTNGEPLTQKCHWPEYKEYVGLTGLNGYKYCTKCNKKKEEHD